MTPTEPVADSGPSRAQRTVIAIGTVSLVLLTAVALLFNPIWIDGTQRRADVPRLTGWPAGEVQRVTHTIVADVVIGPPRFDVSVGGVSVLGSQERSHMRDVFVVLRVFGAVSVAAASAAAALLLRHRGSASAWRAVAAGARGLAILGVALAVAVTLFFDAVWLAFHRIFFPQGNFLFDPATQRLTQLFPDQFWVESATAAVLVGLGIAVLAWGVARSRARRLENLATS